MIGSYFIAPSSYFIAPFALPLSVFRLIPFATPPFLKMSSFSNTSQGISFLHSIGLIHADIKPENVVLYPCDTTNAIAPAPPSTAAVAAASTTTTPTPTSTPTPTPQIQTNAPDSDGDVFCGAGTGEACCGCTSPPANPPPFDLRLIDFGNAVFAADAMPGVTAGTPSYLSPEAQEGLAWGTGVDVWAVGCILFEMVTGDRVCFRRGFVSGDRGGGGGGGLDAGVLWEGCGGERGGRIVKGVMDLVKRLLARERETRPSAADALKDPVFSLV